MIYCYAICGSCSWTKTLEGSGSNQGWKTLHNHFEACLEAKKYKGSGPGGRFHGWTRSKEVFKDVAKKHGIGIKKYKIK